MTIDLNVIIPTSAFGAALGYMLKILLEDKKSIKSFNGEKQEIQAALSNIVDEIIRLKTSSEDFKHRLTYLESLIQRAQSAAVGGLRDNSS